MKLTVREALQITPLKNATILAGAIGLDREVQNVNIVEVPDTVRWMCGGEIMFSSGFAFSGDAEKGCALLASLNQHKISALVLKPGIYMHEVPAAMIEYAEQIGFPLLEVPRDMPFNIYIEAIYALLLDKRSYLFNLDPSMYYFHGPGSVISGELRNICDILVDRIQSPVLYLSIDGTVIEACGEQFLPERGRDTPQNRTIQEWEKTHYLTLVSSDMEPRAYLAVPKHDGFPSETDTAMMEYSAMMISAELQKEKAFIEQKKKYRATLLNDLISQNFGDRRALTRRCELLQFDIDAPYVAFVVNTVPVGPSLEDEENLRTTRNYICHILEHRVVQTACSLLLSERQEQIFGLLSLPEQSNEMVLAQGILNDMLDKLQVACQGTRVIVGMSVPDHGIERIGQAFREAKEAIKINGQLANGKRLVCLKEFGIYRILCELKSSPSMQEFCAATLGSILESDNGEELLKTLECYFENGNNLRKTAEDLFLHKNSVKYRISRIEQLLGDRISNPEVELNLRICLKYRQIL